MDSIIPETPLMSFTRQRTVLIQVPDDNRFDGTQEYLLQLGSASPDVVFTIQNATVTVTDNDGEHCSSDFRF